MTVSPLRQWAEVDVIATLEVRLVRGALRARCSRCGLRRVLYRIAAKIAEDPRQDTSEARCAECWGVRP